MYNLDGNLIRECLHLKAEHKARLIAILQESMDRKKSGDKRFETLLAIATDICGSGIMTHTVEPVSTLGRNMIAYQLRQEGYKTTEIGRLLKRDHSTVVYMISKVHDLVEYPNVFVDEEKIWNKFQQRLKEHDEKHM